jgi:hypothetical protein
VVASKRQEIWGISVDRVASELVVPTVNLIRLGREKQATLEVREPFSFVLMVRAQRRRNFGRPCEQIVEEAAAQVENLLFNKPLSDGQNLFQRFNHIWSIHIAGLPLDSSANAMIGKSKAKTVIELRPDGWERFRRAITAAAKSGPRHRSSKEKPKEPNRQPRKH